MRRSYLLSKPHHRCMADRILKDGSGAQCMLPRRKGSFYCHKHQDYPTHDSRIDVRPVGRKP